MKMSSEPSQSKTKLPQLMRNFSSVPIRHYQKTKQVYKTRRTVFFNRITSKGTKIVKITFKICGKSYNDEQPEWDLYVHKTLVSAQS